MEKVGKKGLVFRFVLASFLVIFFISSYLRTVDPPAFQSVVNAIFIPLEALGEATMPPVNRFLESLNAIFDFFDGGGLPGFDDLIALFTSPFLMLMDAIKTIISLLSGLLDIFT